MLKLIIQPTVKISRSVSANLRPSDSAPNFALARNVVSAGLIANLRYLLTARGVTIPGEAKGGAFLPQQFRASFLDNLKEFFRPAPRFTGDPVGSLRGIASPGIKIESQPLYLSILQNIRDAIAPPKLSPLDLTSKPVEIPEIWSKHRRLSVPNVVSVVLHVMLTVLVLVFTVRQVTNPDPVKPVTVLIAPPAAAASPSPVPVASQPVTHRVAPAQRKSFFVHGKLTAPTAIPRVVNAKRRVGDVGVPDLTLGIPGGGPGEMLRGVLVGETGGLPGGGGISVAPPPPGVATTKSGIVRVGGDVKPPKAIYAPAPEFSPLARRANLAGVVVLDAVVDEHGNVVKLHAVSGPGLLIGAALKAVARWKFEPTILDGKPISIEMEVRVTFHLMPH